MAELNERIRGVEVDLENLRDSVAEDRETNSKFRHGFRKELMAKIGTLQMEALTMNSRIKTIEQVAEKHEKLLEELRPDSWRGAMKTGVVSGGTIVIVLGVLKALLELFSKLAEVLVRAAG